ncbi:MAG: hypothetical protein WD737_02150 [Gemmatimonadota bacterium]
MYRKLIAITIALMPAIWTAPAEAQLGGRLSAEPYVAYGFYGALPETTASLEAGIAYGGRIAFRLVDQWAVFGNFQRSTPQVVGNLPGVQVEGGELEVDHWSGGIEFSYVPRGGASGMLPIQLEAGLGQARYEGGSADLAVNLGIASALQLSPNLAIRYGANDYVSNYRDGNGVEHQVFVRIGAELSL